MAIIKTKAIVLNAIKYGDSSLIVKCFTLESGLKSYMIRGVLKSRRGKIKPAYFQPFTQLHLEANHNERGKLNSIKEVQVINPYKTVSSSVIKQSIVLFLSEILSTIIKEEEKNETLYNYLETALIWLDLHNNISNFHLLFLLNLTRFLGFYPDMKNSEYGTFNLLEGKFVLSTKKELQVTGKDLTLFKSLLGINFDAVSKLHFSKNERQIVLKNIIKYFELHLDGFRTPKSLKVLEAIYK